MTIIYQYKVATTSYLGFFKLLKCWRGSIYKLMYKELFVFCGLYGVISLIYRFVLNKEQQRVFEGIAAYCNSYTSLIPVSFVLGFYVSIVVHRWWQQFTNVPWPDRTLFIMGSYIHGNDEQSRIIRRTVARYLMFGEILILRSISVAVMKRYPSLEHIIDSGIITQDEALLYDQVECKYNKFWVPLVWANSVLTQARRDGKIESDIGFRLIMEQLADFRDKCSLCFVFDWITIPLVYTQVVTLACHMFFAACLIGRQYVHHDGDGFPDLYVPVFTIVQFFFYMGWLKVAEQMINPFGEDDDDFDLNWLIDRHTAVAMCLVDQCHSTHPPLVKDTHFNEVVSDLPYTAASLPSKRPNFLGSTYNLAQLSVADQKIVPDPRLMEINVHGHRRAYNYDNLHHRQPANYRKISKGSRAGSMLSLFGFKGNNLQRNHMAGSRDTLMSASTTANGYLYVPTGTSPNDHVYTQSPSLAKRNSEPNPVDETTELLPEYVPLRRARASTDADHKPLKRLIEGDKERKWSFPLSLLRRKHSREERASVSSSRNSSLASLDARVTGSAETMPVQVPPNQSRTTPRFVVEPVQGDQDADTKYNRNKQIMDMHLSAMAASNRPSRPPLLSAIEEGGTIRSISELVGSSSSHSLELSSPTSEGTPFDTIDLIPAIDEGEEDNEGEGHEESEGEERSEEGEEEAHPRYEDDGSISFKAIPARTESEDGRWT